MASEEFHDDLAYAIRGAVLFCAGVAIAITAAIWIGLWAINKPVHPDACANYRGAECAAAVAK